MALIKGTNSYVDASEADAYFLLGLELPLMLPKI
jgi:hypothetical protein